MEPTSNHPGENPPPEIGDSTKEADENQTAAAERMRRIDELCSHVWMVRTFLKHSEEAEEDDELCEVHRDLYDFMLALGPALQQNDPATYLKQAKKKLKRLRRGKELFDEIQPEISEHTNFKMARNSLALAVAEIERLIVDPQ